MAPKKRSGRAAAEAAFAALLSDARAMVGDVGDAHEVFVAKLADVGAAQKRYEDARSAAIKAGAITNDQLDAMGYRKTPKLPTLGGEEQRAAVKKPAAAAANSSGPDRAAGNEAESAQAGSVNSHHN